MQILTLDTCVWYNSRESNLLPIMENTVAVLNFFPDNILKLKLKAQNLNYALNKTFLSEHATKQTQN